VAVDAEGNLYIADGLDHRIRRVDARSGIITTVAGTGQAGLSGDGSSATSARINRPGGVAIDADSLSIGDRGNQRIRKVTTSTGLITTVVGSEAFIGDGKLATEAGLNFPKGTIVDASNHLYIADSLHHRVRRVDGATGVITTVAGAGQPGFGGDGGPATNAQLAAPQAVAVDASGNLYIADTGNHRVRQVDGRTGIITTVAGTGAPGFGGDGGLAINAHLFAPSGVAIDARRNLFIADKLNHRIRRVDLATGLITTVAGNGTAGFRGDQGSAISASLNASEAVALDASGNYLFIADTANHRIRQVDRSTGNITTIAGSGSSGNFAGDGGPATQARLNRPTGVAVDEAGNFYIADTFNHRIRRVDRSPEGIITTVAGNGEPGFSGDGQAAVQARLDEPTSVAVDAQGSLYIADMLNHRIRRVSAR
jgi:sugar lactone lactonase YvrE